MDSHSKIPLPAAQLERIVASHFGPDLQLANFEELREGFFNAAALLELSDGRKLVLKAAPPAGLTVMRYEKDLMRAEVESMRLVRGETPVLVPEIFVYDTTHTLLPSDFYIMQFVSGVPFHKLRKDLTPEAQHQVEIQMGRMCRQIGQITGPSFGLWVQPEPAGGTWRDCFDHMLQGILLDAQEQHVDLEMPHEQVYQLMRNHFDVLDEITIPRLVHWDMWDGNVFVDPATLQVTGLIDFERVLWGDPLTESFFLTIKPGSGYLEGYGEDLFGSSSMLLRRALYDTYLYLILIIECYFRHYPNNDQENWARGAIKEMYRLLK